jgi:hypothetical protein
MSSSRPPVPDNPIFVSFCHPTNKRLFLSLPKNNVLPSTSEIFGVHHETALTACQIIACNEPGFLSTSTDRSDINARTSPEHHQFLTSKRYYYHLVTQPDDPNYRICVDFAFWSFPHNHLPPSWARATPIDDAGFSGSNWTDISSRIKQRDLHCRVSDWFDNKSTAYIVPADETHWVCYLLLVLSDIIVKPVFPDIYQWHGCLCRNSQRIVCPPGLQESLRFTLGYPYFSI